MAEGRKQSVLLIGDPPAEQFHSMDIYADALEAALREHDEYEIKRFQWREGYTGRGTMARTVSLYFNRFITYPRQLAGINADIYHILDHSYAHLIRELPPQRTVITCHDLIPLQMPEYRSSLGGKLSSAAFRHSLSYLKRAAVIISDSNATKEALIHEIGVAADMVHVIPLGIDPVFFNSAEERSLAEGCPVKRLLQVGATVEAYKNTANILQAFRIVAKQYGTAIRLVKVGKPYSEKHQECIRSWGLAGQVDYLGFVDRDRLVQIYHSTDVLLMPSLDEGFGLPILEAMACGTPVLTSKRGSIPEVAGEAVLYVDPLNPDDIASGVKRILGDAALSTGLRNKGRDRAVMFNWGKTATGTAAVYRQLERESIAP